MTEKITVFTPTFNRAYILGNLYNSLVKQTDFNFEWLIVDDGSTDHTEILVNEWILTTTTFNIRYYKFENGGKPRAINRAVALAETSYMFIVDSDDYLVTDLVAFLRSKLPFLRESEEFAALGVLRGKENGATLQKPRFHGREYIDASNLQRKNYGLNIDCNEMYKLEILKRYPFVVWENELFSPEEIVFNQIALDGYKVRWYNKIGVISEYLKDGLTLNSFKLMLDNPMGFAMSYNHQLKHEITIREKVRAAYLMVGYLLLARNLKYLAKTNNIFLTTMAFPCGCAVALRRRLQYKAFKSSEKNA